MILSSVTRLWISKNKNKNILGQVPHDNEVQYFVTNFKQMWLMTINQQINGRCAGEPRFVFQFLHYYRLSQSKPGRYHVNQKEMKHLRPPESFTSCEMYCKNITSTIATEREKKGASVELWTVHEALQPFLIVLAARLIGDFHPGQVDALVHQQLLGVQHRFQGQEPRAAEDPRVFDAEQTQDVRAGVDHRQAGVVGGQNPVRTVGGDWEQGGGVGGGVRNKALDFVLQIELLYYIS